MTVRSASTRTIGRTTDAAPLSSRTPARCVLIGRPITLSLPIQKVVLISTNANFLMVGKNKNTIPTSSKSKNANMGRAALSLIAPITTVSSTGRLNSISGLNTSRRVATKVASRPTFTYRVMVLNRIR